MQWCISAMLPQRRDFFKRVPCLVVSLSARSDRIRCARVPPTTTSTDINLGLHARAVCSLGGNREVHMVVRGTERREPVRRSSPTPPPQFVKPEAGQMPPLTQHSCVISSGSRKLRVPCPRDISDANRTILSQCAHRKPRYHSPGTGFANRSRFEQGSGVTSRRPEVHRGRFRLGVGSSKSISGSALRNRSPSSRTAWSVGVSGGGPAIQSYSRRRASISR
jgi:hypothetical protein